VVTSRAEEFFLRCLPAGGAVVKIRSGLTADGRIGFWDYQVCGRRRAVRPRCSTTSSTSARSRPAGGWRESSGHASVRGGAVAVRHRSNTNTFARESQIDMLAARAGRDPPSNSD